MILTHYAIRFRTAVLVAMAAIIVVGIASYVTIPREGTPDITIPFVFLNAIYEGVAPEEMENLVTIPLEKKLRDLDNLKEIRSVSMEGVSSISIEFTPKENINDAQQRVKEKVDLARPDLPPDLDEPIVQAFNYSTDFPILMVALHGETDVERLRLVAEDLQDRVETVPGVKEASLVGLREREIRVEFDPDRLNALGLTLHEVRQRLAQENRTFSAGNLELPDTRLRVRVPGEFKLASDLTSLIIAHRNGRPIVLRDIAQVTDTFKDLDTISRVNGEPCVTIQIKKRSGENTVRINRRIQEVLDQTPLPPGVRLTVTLNQANMIRMMVAELENNIFSGFLLVVIVIYLALGGRNSLLVGMAIPLAMLLSFILLTIRGISLNMLVLFSLVMAVGMLVDNAIVIVENIYRNHMNGLGRTEAARVGAAEVAWPVATATLTTIAVFVPLMYWPGIMGQFMGFLPRTLILVLISSLFVALIINPAVASLLIRRGPVQPAGGPLSRYERIVNGYERLLRGALQHRGAVLFLGLLLLILSGQIYHLLDRETELFPDVEPQNATVSVRYPQGTPIEQTDALLHEVEKRVAALPDVKFGVTTVGVIGGAGMGGGSGSHLGAVTIEFLDAADRTQDTRLLIEQLRRDIGQFPGAEIKVAKQEMGPPTGAPISLEISGDDFEVLADLSAEIQRRMRRVPGVVDIQDDFEDARPEMQFVADRARAARLGVDTSTIGQWMRSSLFGMEASKLRAGEDQVDITLRLPVDNRADLDMLRNLRISLPDGRVIPLSSLGELRYAAGRGEIRRKDQKRMITINADRETDRSVDRVIADIRGELSDLALPVGYRIAYRGDTQEMQEASAFLGQAFAIAIGLIAIILVTQFNSLLLPLIILMSVILSMIGVLWGLILCGLRFSVIMTGVGVISLAGVVVNNSIVLVDCMNRVRLEGLSADEAIIEAGKRRLRPVLLTALTTILGLIPMAIGWSLDIHSWPPRFVAGAESSAWWAPMAVAIIFGLFFATILTLVQVPVMCSIAEKGILWFQRRFGHTD